MYGEIITIGRELLMGEIVDTNASFLAQRLAGAGVTVRWVSQVGDDMDHLVDMFERALERSDVIVTSGGLGPTSDDLTREAVARVMGETPQVDPGLLKWLEGVFLERGIPMPATNIKQATLIPSATTIPNNGGTAPGWWVERNGKHIILTPGPPREILRMWSDYIGPKLQGLTGADVVFTRTLKTAGVTEGGIDEMLSDLFGHDNPYLGIYARPDGIHLRIIARAIEAAQAESLCQPVEQQIRTRLGAAIWGVDEETPGTRVRDLLLAGHRTLAVAEGASGGALSAMLAETSGIDQIFRGSLISGSAGFPPGIKVNQSIMGRLNGNPAAGLAEDSALAMASAAREAFGADIGVGITPPSDGIVVAGIVSAHGQRTASGRFRQAPAVAMQRTALLALVELATALSANEI